MRYAVNDMMHQDGYRGVRMKGHILLWAQSPGPVQGQSFPNRSRQQELAEEEEDSADAEGDRRRGVGGNCRRE